MMRNPFSDTKIESESEPVLWFSDRCSKIASRGKSTYVSGARGSGKTSILRSLSTRYIYEIPSLREQLSAVRLGWFGTYIRLQNAFSDILFSGAQEHNNSNQSSEFIVFAAYIESIISVQLLEDISELKRSGFFAFSALDEHRAVRAVVDSLPRLSGRDTGARVDTLRDVKDYFDDCTSEIFTASISGDIAVAKKLAGIPGKTMSSLVAGIGPLVRGPRMDRSKKIRFKLLVDDCETLPPRYQTYFNTLVRSTSEPISWVAAFVGNAYDSRTTIRKSQMLSDADREIELLDQIKEREFKHLCARVSSLRLFSSLDESVRRKAKIKSPQDAFDLPRRLGRFSLNCLVHESFKHSVSPKTRAWEQKAQSWRTILLRTKVSDEEKLELEIEGLDLPYTLAATAEVLQISPESAMKKMSDERSRRAFHRTLARKQRSAFLYLGKQAGTKLILAGEAMVLGLSDGCIRDFLEIMKEVVDRECPVLTQKALLRFMTQEKPVLPVNQSAAIYAASAAKVRGISVIADPYGASVTRLVSALGTLTGELQSNQRAISTPEVGIFRINWLRLHKILADLKHSPTALDELFRQSEGDGFVREVTREGRIMSLPDGEPTRHKLFRLHRRFAPAFGFSFRGPYEEFTLPEVAFAEVITSKESFSVSSWVQKLVDANETQVGDINQMTIPGLSRR